MSSGNSTRKGNPMIQGVIWKQILSFFFPILIGVFFQQLYNTVDAVVVGNFAGKEALASVGGSSGQIVGFIFSFFMGLSTGATVIIAQSYGAGRTGEVDDALHTAYAYEAAAVIAIGRFADLHAILRAGMNEGEHLCDRIIIDHNTYMAHTATRTGTGEEHEVTGLHLAALHRDVARILVARRVADIYVALAIDVAGEA